MLKVYTTTANGFDERDIRTLELMAGLLAAAMSHAAEFESKVATLAALEESEDRYRSVIAALEEGVILQAEDGSIEAVNSSAEQILGLSMSRMLAMTSNSPTWDAVHEDGSPFDNEEHPAMKSLLTGKPYSRTVMGMRRPDGDLAWLSVNSQPLFRPGSDKPYGVVSSFSDITEQKRAEQALKDLAIRDELTGLYNRREMDRILAEEVARSKRYGRPMSLLMLDVDHFKKINDTHGHQIGDSVLHWVAQLLQNNLRTADRLARYGRWCCWWRRSGRRPVRPTRRSARSCRKQAPMKPPTSRAASGKLWPPRPRPLLTARDAQLLFL